MLGIIYIAIVVPCSIHVRNTFATELSVHFIYLLIFDVITTVISFSALLNTNYIRCEDTKYMIHTHAHTFTRSFVADTGIYSVECLTRVNSFLAIEYSICAEVTIQCHKLAFVLNFWNA